MSFPSELILLHKTREKEILDNWLDVKGLDISIKPVVVDSASPHDLDPFNIDIQQIGYEEGSITNYGVDFKAKAVLMNEQFQFSEISYDILVEEINGSDDSSNFNEIYCFISGDIIPKYSILTFDNFPAINLRIDKIAKKRPLSDIYRYKLVRC